MAYVEVWMNATVDVDPENPPRRRRRTWVDIITYARPFEGGDNDIPLLEHHYLV